MPVLYMGGDQDALLYSKKSARRLTQLLPQADVRVLEKNTSCTYWNDKEYNSFFRILEKSLYLANA